MTDDQRDTCVQIKSWVLTLTTSLLESDRSLNLSTVPPPPPPPFSPPWCLPGENGGCTSRRWVGPYTLNNTKTHTFNWHNKNVGESSFKVLHLKLQHFPRSPNQIHRHISITSVSHQYHISITSVSHQYHISITSVSHQYHISITSVSHQYHISITSVSHQYHISITSVPYIWTHQRSWCWKLNRQRHANANLYRVLAG